jgi:hypothetical protein
MTTTEQEELDHLQHLEANVFVHTCTECVVDLTAVDWVLAVRKYGLTVANELFA